MKEEEWSLVLDINLKGSFILHPNAFKHMMKTAKAAS
jgi:NAD(P)-dependent dehydrogenase (short-subunit alcohol dehydrogenase family)